MKKIFFVVFIMSVFVPTVMACSNYDKSFYKNLKSCKPYHTDFTEEQNNIKKVFSKNISGFENNKCTVSFTVTSSSEETKADAADIEICSFPKRELKKINQDNIMEYKNKFCVPL